MSLGRLVLQTSSTSEPLTRSETKTWLRIEEEELSEDSVIDQLIVTARQRYEAYTRRSLLKQTFDYYLPDFPSGSIALPRAPLVSVDSIKGFTDTDATDTGGTAMNSSEYYTDTASEPGRVIPFGAYTFPSATRVSNGAIIRFTAGYTSQTSGVPDQAKTTLLNMVARAYEYRGDQSAAEIEALMDEVMFNELSLPEWG